MAKFYKVYFIVLSDCDGSVDYVMYICVHVILNRHIFIEEKCCKMDGQDDGWYHTQLCEGIVLSWVLLTGEKEWTIRETYQNTKIKPNEVEGISNFCYSTWNYSYK